MALPAPTRAHPDLSFLLAHTSHVLNTRLTAALAGIGMSVRGHCVLMHALPGELTQIELAKLTDLDKTTMVVTVDELVEAGLAERQASPTDRRARIVAVTEAGRAMAAAGEQIVDRVHAEVVASLPGDEGAMFLSALRHLVDGYLADPVECDRPVRRPRQARG